jgi:hypothetical protein
MRQLFRPNLDGIATFEFILSPYVLHHMMYDVELIVSIILMLLEARKVDSMPEAVSLSVGVILLDFAICCSPFCVVESFI